MLTPITRLLGVVIWPITVLVCVLLLRPFLTKLVPLIRTVKYSDIEIRFGQEVAELKAAAATSLRTASVEEDFYVTV